MSTKSLNELFDSGKDVRFVDVFEITTFGMVAGVIYPTKAGLLLKYYRRFLLTCVFSFFYISVYITIYVDLNIEGGTEDMIRQVAMLVLVTTAYLKFSTFHKHAEVVTEILNYIHEDYLWMKNAGSKHREAMFRYIKLAKTIELIWMGLVLVVGLSFPTISIIKMVSSALFDETFKRQMAYDFYLIFLNDYKFISPLYEITYLATVLVDLVFMAVYLGYDVFTVVAKTHVCGLLECLKLDALELFDTEEPFDRAACNRRILVIIEKQQRIYRIVELITTITNFVYLIDLFLDSVEITFAGYHIIKCFEKGVISYEFIMFIIAAVAHVLLPCYFCDLITEKSLEFRDAVYFSGWERDLYKPLCQNLLFVMMRTSLPITISTGLNPVNMVMFSSVIRTSSSIFALVKSTQEQ